MKQLRLLRQARAPVGLRASGGFVLPLLLGVLVLLGALAAAITNAGRGSLQQAQAVGNVMVLYTQAQLIRTKLVKCAFDFPQGDNGTGYRRGLPAASTADADVQDLSCPGAPNGLQALWAGTDAVFLPPPPAGFGAWRYRNDATSARISIQAAGSDGLATLQAVLARFAAAEASVDNTSRTLTLVIQT